MSFPGPQFAGSNVSCGSQGLCRSRTRRMKLGAVNDNRDEISISVEKNTELLSVESVKTYEDRQNCDFGFKGETIYFRLKCDCAVADNKIS